MAQAIAKTMNDEMKQEGRHSQIFLMSIELSALQIQCDIPKARIPAKQIYKQNHDMTHYLNLAMQSK